jgi:diaminohydroxyphosphoribosylaminopyrimidine deaminase/5-amino-6-(5-phosphoribosylamino)uracil reductase
VSDFTAADRRWMRRALTLARRGWGRTSPNPMVGAVIVRDDEVVGEGWHAEHGAAHAEIAALARASEYARGATLYVTLEPCNHVGRTPACAPALVDAGLGRVVIAADDPNPVAKGGADTLRRAGIVVETGLFAADAAELNPAFHSRFARNRPFVTLKLAVSLDGGIANPGTGVARLTGKAAERAVHMMRAAHDAIAVGSGTAVADDPQLTVRGVRRPRIEPTRIVFDRRGRLSGTATLARTAKKVPTVLVTEPGAGRALAETGVIILEASSLKEALGALGKRGIDSILFEGGATMAGALLSGGFVDRLVIFQAPVLLGPGAISAFSFPPGEAAVPVARWRVVEQARFEDDVMTVYAPQR